MNLCAKHFLINGAALRPRGYQAEDSGLAKPGSLLADHFLAGFIGNMKSERTKAGPAQQLNSELSLPIRQPPIDLMSSWRKSARWALLCTGLDRGPGTIHNADPEAALIDKDGDQLALDHVPYINEMEKSVASS